MNSEGPGIDVIDCFNGDGLSVFMVDVRDTSFGVDGVSLAVDLIPKRNFFLGKTEARTS